MTNSNKEKILKPHSLSLSSRKDLKITGISDVDSFNEEIIVAYTDYGELIIRGKNLKMENLSIDSGQLQIKGDINSLAYAEARNGKSVFSKIFK